MEQAAGVDIGEETVIKGVVDAYPGVKAVFLAHGLKCSTCWISHKETIAMGARTHHIAVEPLLEDVRRFVREGTVPTTVAPQPVITKPIQDKLPKRDIRHVIAVMSGKGGVGKSLVSSLLAITLRRHGCAVGILDADITGPSIPRMFGVRDRRQFAPDKTVVPGESQGGIKVMSMNLLLPREDVGVNWRGPMLSQSIKSFFSDAAWGALDYLVIDLPPGTSDAPMTVLQSIPLDGAILVSTPQALATMVVYKAVKMVQRLQVPILGLVENMGYITLPGTGEPYELFGPSRGAALVGETGAPLLGRLPLDPAISGLCDDGRIEEFHSPALDELGLNFLKVLEVVEAP